ncbi:NAD(P)-dependent oxidoreductase [Pseudonocardia sp. CA-107938]|uniref:NAD(P)-dependent oxidoreductase n=1 Tax=Pseudonocardia sp. CA-107938 TaxID=3240021 RepID=UPI003D8A2623
MVKVVVFGAGGRTGRLVVEEAVGAGHEVVAAARGPLDVPGVRTVRVDVRDADAVTAALAGQDVVVSAVGPARRTADGLYSAAAGTIVAGMAAAGVDRLVAVTSSGVRVDDPHHPWWYRLLARTAMREAYGDMRRMEEIVRASGVDYTFVRPARLVDEPGTGTVRVVDGANPPGGLRVTRADLARFVVEELTARQWSRAAPTMAE